MAQHGPHSRANRSEIRALSLEEVQAALANYRANQTEIDADLESEALETEALENRHRR